VIWAHWLIITRVTDPEIERLIKELYNQRLTFAI
jgi:hypothetical protein